MDNYKVFAIVVTYNGIGWIHKCIESLIESSVKPKILVVDNNSSDGTQEYIRNRFSEVELFESKINLGFGKGNNYGLKRALDANADYAFLLNQDAYVESDTIEKLIKFNEANENFGILSPIHLNWDKSDLEYYFSTIITPQSCPNFINDLYKHTLQTGYNINFIHAAAWMINKKALSQAGGFNPLFHHYCEDLDYVNRILFKKFDIGVITNCFVMHKGTHQGLKDYSANYYLEFHYNLVDFLNPKYKLSSVLLRFIKKSFDKATSSFLFFEWKKMAIQIRLIFAFVIKYPQIKRYRKVSLKNEAFLTDE